MLAEIILFCLVIFLILFFVFLCFASIAIWSSLALALTFMLIILVIRYPPTLLISEVPSSMCTLYTIIIAVTLLVLFFYILAKCMQDRACKYDRRDTASSDCS